MLGNSGWLSYVRGDYRIGENIEGWGMNAGLRYQFSPERRGSIKDAPVALYAYNSTDLIWEPLWEPRRGFRTVNIQ